MEILLVEHPEIVQPGHKVGSFSSDRAHPAIPVMNNVPGYASMHCERVGPHADSGLFTVIYSTGSFEYLPDQFPNRFSTDFDFSLAGWEKLEPGKMLIMAGKTMSHRLGWPGARHRRIAPVHESEYAILTRVQAVNHDQFYDLDAAERIEPGQFSLV